MKKYLILFSLLIFALSCKKNTSEPTPVAPTAYNNLDEANKAVGHTYNVLSNKSLYGAAYMQFTELASDDVTSKLSTEDTDDMNWSNSNSANIIKEMFTGCYLGIYHANLVLSTLKNSPSISEENKKQIVAEAKFLRALYYWHVVALFGKAPVYITPVSNVDPKSISGTSMNDIYTQIESDLNDAIAGFSATNFSLPTKANYWSAKTLLAKTYLWWGSYSKDQTKFAKSATLFKEVIGSGKYLLLQDFNSVFSPDKENNNETIFEVDFEQGGETSNGWCSQDQSPNCSKNTQRDLRFGIQNQPGQYGFGEFIATQDWANNGEIGDPRVRKSLIFVWDSTLSGYEAGTNNKSKNKMVYKPSWGRNCKASGNILGEYYHVKKAVNGFVGAGSSINSGNNWRMIRYSDVLLMAAEAINESEGATVEAIGYLNAVRLRAKASTNLAYGITNNINTTNPSYFETVSGSNFLNPYPYIASNSDAYNPFSATIDEIDLSTTSKETLTKAIILERRAELAFEYHRFLDIRRWEAFSNSHPGAAATVFKNKIIDSDKKNYSSSTHGFCPLPLVNVDVLQNISPEFIK